MSVNHSILPIAIFPNPFPIRKNTLSGHFSYRNFAAVMGKEKQSGKIQLIEGWTFEKINYTLFVIGVLLIITGYFVMANGTVNSFQSLTLAPILLFLGYIIIIPAALIYRSKQLYLGSQFSWLERWPVKPEVASSSLVGPALNLSPVCSRHAGFFNSSMIAD